MIERCHHPEFELDVEGSGDAGDDVGAGRGCGQRHRVTGRRPAGTAACAYYDADELTEVAEDLGIDLCTTKRLSIDFEILRAPRRASRPGGTETDDLRPAQPSAS